MIQQQTAEKLGVNTTNSNSMTEAKENLLEQVKQLLPNVVNSDNQLNTQALADLFDLTNTTSNNQGYELTFAGKGIARAKADEDTTKELRYKPKQSKDQGEHAATENIIIRGDNIDALKVLYKNYHNSIKMIYIDPPYNTKSENFIYNDNFKQSEAKLIEEFGLAEETTNFLDNVYGTRSHSGWLSFMYPRLKLARELLSDDGIIFISIGEEELYNLKTICDEIFGEDFGINHFVWQKNSSGKTVSKQYPVNIDHILMYSKSNAYNLLNIYKPLADATIAMYNRDDNDGRGKYRLFPLQKTKSPGPETSYDYIDNNGKLWPCPPKGWRMKKSKLKELENDNRLCLNGTSLQEKAYWEERENEGKVADTLWNDLAENHIGTAEVKKLFNQEIFSNPKPTDLIKRCLKTIKTDNSTILDFFAGSGTTAHAVMQQNAEDGGNRKYIMVQWDEAINPEKSKTAYDFCNEHKLEPVISSIAIERINRAGEKIKAENPDKKVDIGYKVYTLEEKPQIVTNPNNQQLELAHQRTTSTDTLINMLVATCKPLHTQVKEIQKDVLYEADNEIYVTGALNPEDLQPYTNQKINIDAFTNFKLEDFLNLNTTLNKENITVVY